jgi:RNA polymerase sigma-70 factor (ECF subfamily)
LQRCIEGLPSKVGRAFMMREWLEYETPEICQQLGITRSNCNVMLFRARMRLRDCVESRWLGKASGACAGAMAPGPAYTAHGNGR